MKNKLLPALVIACLLTVAFYSCTKKTEQFTGDYSKNYFPLTEGKNIVYDVDSTIWDDFTCVKSTFHYQMRWTISDTFRDNENRLSYRIDTHVREEDSLDWQTHRVIFVTPTETSLEYVEENLRFIKLIFPIQNGGTWQGNALISALDQEYQYFQGWDYYYDHFSEPFNNGFAYFDNTVTVNAVDDTVNNPETMPAAYASKTFAKEVYAQGVGMVYREMLYWTYDPTGATGACRKGYSVIMRAIDHN